MVVLTVLVMVTMMMMAMIVDNVGMHGDGSSEVGDGVVYGFAHSARG